MSLGQAGDRNAGSIHTCLPSHSEQFLSGSSHLQLGVVLRGFIYKNIRGTSSDTLLKFSLRHYSHKAIRKVNEFTLAWLTRGHPGHGALNI